MIKDDGKGFDTKGVGNKKGLESRGFGVSIMKERVLLLSGDIKIISGKGKGTQITVIVPIV